MNRWIVRTGMLALLFGVCGLAAAIAANTTAKPKGPSTAPALIPHPTGIGPLVVVSSRVLGSDWTDLSVVTEAKETSDYDLLLVATTTQDYDGINHRQMDRTFTYGTMPTTQSHLDIFNIENLPAGVSHSSDTAHWKGHLESTRLFGLDGVLVSSTDIATFSLDRVKASDGPIFDYAADPINPPIVFSNIITPEHVSLTGDAARNKITEWSSPSLVFDVYHDFNHPETLTSSEYHFYSETSTAPKSADAQAREWDAGHPFADSASAFEATDEPIAFLKSTAGNRKALQKIQYKVGLTTNSALDVVWLELFTPSDSTQPVGYSVKSWHPVSGVLESPVYTIDPLGIDPADDHAADRIPDEEGEWEIFLLDIGAAVDGNHDGTISIGGADVPDADHPYTHGPNWDHDGGTSATDGLDGMVNGQADLKDFFPVFLNVKQLTTILPPSSSITYKLKQADGALNFVYSNLTAATAFGYLTDTAGVGYGPSLAQPAASASTLQITQEGVDLFGGASGSPEFLEAIKNRDGGVILVEGRTFSKNPLLLEISRDGQVILQFTLSAQISLGEIAVDANRDGIIKFAREDGSDATTTRNPYRFWLNNDDDVDDDAPENSENAPVSTLDSIDDKVDGIRDLEDFTRLKIYLGGLADVVRQGQILVGLKWKGAAGFGGGPGIKLWRNLSPDGSTGYLTDMNIARQHLALRDPGTIQGTKSYIIPTQYWTDAGLSELQPYGNLLFEGISVGKDQLVITLHNADGTEISEGGGVWLDLKNIKSMYERVVATANGAEDLPFPYNYIGSNPVPAPEMGWMPNPGANPFEPTPSETATYIVFVHGWNQTYDRSVMYAETMFKRLWHCGYKGRFAAFRWPTFTGLTSYNDSEYRAWKCGVSLKQYLDSIPSTYTINLVAHSMGNIVSGSALEKGATVAKYALLNAAVPAICYDTSGGVTQTSWGYVTPNEDSDSVTVALSYQGRLSSVSGNLVNFFLPNDSALAAWELNNDSPAGGRYPLVGSKPQQWPEGSLDNAGYFYQRTAANSQKLKVTRVDGQRILAVADEAMAFAVQAPSLTAGADGRTRGSIRDWADMTVYGFDSVHSAEFLFTIHQTRGFYEALLRKFGVAIQP